MRSGADLMWPCASVSVRHCFIAAFQQNTVLLLDHNPKTIFDFISSFSVQFYLLLALALKLPLLYFVNRKVLT